MDRYNVVEHLHDGAVFSLDRARDLREDRSVVLKRLPASRSSPAERARLRREFELLRDLAVPGVVRALALEEDAAELRLVLEDVGGATLAERMSRGRLSVDAFLDLATQLAEIVGQMHLRQVLHKDIKPRNILVDPAGRVQLIDFGIASALPRQIAPAGPPQVLEGTLAYIAPEQTGRMNRPVDARSDLYALGATLYEMLTGRPPFAVSDPLELIHCHIARPPTPPVELDPELPPVLSDMVLKLLAKHADARYQSAFGLRHDLARARALLAEEGPQGRFPLGQRDVPARFELPARLYGREAAVARLVDAYRRARAGEAALVLVAGPAGIGKSAVIHELDRELASHGGRLVAGKFEQLRRDEPYSAVRDALAALVPGLLAEPEVALARRRQALERGLGRLRGPLLELLPELGQVLASRRASAGASEGDTPGAARGRLQRAVRALVAALVEPGAPLVLVLDDLQWADAASLELLAALLGEDRPPGLLVVGALRDEGPLPGLEAALAEVARGGASVSRIDLAPLEPADTRALVVDALRCPDDEARALAELVHDRTGGVPLLVGEYLRDLDRHGLLALDGERLRWTWDLSAIAGAAVSADVVALMVERTRSLGQVAREALAYAACAGGEFDAALLAGLSRRPEAEVAAALVEAARAGLVVACGERYRFFHDRVLQAVASTLREDERQEIHLALARRLGEGAPLDEHHPRLFEVADHFNAAAARVRDAEERRALAGLDLAAARRARGAGAFAALAAYAGAGAEFLGDEGRAGASALWFSLGLLRAEGLFVSGALAEAEALLAELSAQAPSPRDRALVCQLWSALDLHVGRLESAIARAFAGLAALGSPMPRKVGVAAVGLEFLRTRAALGRRAPEDLLTLPPLSDPQVWLVLKLYSAASGAAFQVDPLLMTAIALRTTRLSLQHGNSNLAPAEYISYGLMVGALGRDFPAMDGFGRVALALLERYPDRGVEAVVKFLYGVMIQPWCHPFREVLPVLREAMQAGLESGQLLYAGIAGASIGVLRLQMGAPLEQARQDLEHARAFARSSRLPSTEVQLVPLFAAVDELTGLEVPEATDDDASRDPLTRHAGWIWGAWRHLLMGRLADARALSDRAEPGVARALGFAPTIADHAFVRGLALAATGDARGPVARLRLRRAIERCAARLARYAALCPANFACRALLVRAELARVCGDEAAAIRGYEDAIASAVAHGRPHDEALACETAARHYWSAGLTDPGRLYLGRARRAYLRWGATARARLLERQYPGIERWGLGDAAPAGRDTSTGLRTEPGTTSRPGVALDFASLLRATQVLAEELELDRLLAAVMRLVVENAGAERGALLLAREAGLVGARAYAIHGDALVDLREAPLEELHSVPTALVLLSQRTGKPVVVDDAERDPRLAEDPYVRRVRPRSLLAVPLVHGGARLGVLVLENGLAAGVFTPERTETLRLLAAQAAIAIERAMFVARLDEARRAALAASEAKSRFLANMSHELRTPLNAILGYSEMLLEDAAATGAEDMLEDLRKISRAGAHLLGIVRDILDLTKIESGTLTAAREPIELPALLEDVAAVCGPDIERGGNEFARAWRPELGGMLGDPALLRQVLVNLLGNAAKFTARGRVCLRAERCEGWLRFEVEDTGIGMSEAQMLTIFEPFTQVDGSSTRRYGGVGLGLTICRKLTEAMGGRIHVRSEPGRGSVFTVELPAPA